MRRVLLVVLALAAVAAFPAGASAQNCGKTPTPPGAPKFPGGEVPPDIEQYAPDFAEQQRAARGAPCGPGSAAGGGTTPGANEQVEGVPPPPSVGGSGGPGSGAAAGPTTTRRVGKPPVPVASRRTKLADVTSPVISAGPTGPAVPVWALFLIAAVLLGGFALFLFGAGFSRLRPLGVAAEEARARTSDKAIELRETVRFGR